MPKVTLITTMYNESIGIVDFIQSINRQSTLPDEVVFVDGGSTDNTIELIKKTLRNDIVTQIIVDPTCSKTYSRGPIARGRNVAIHAATHEHIVVTDAGCELHQEWVSEMKAGFNQGNVDVVSGWYKARVRNAFQNHISEIFCPPLSKVDPENFLPSSRSIGFTKTIWKKAGHYPEDSYTAEDTVFDLRLRAVGGRHFFQPAAIVYWDLPSDIHELKTKLIRYGEGDGQHRIFLLRYLTRAIFLIGAPLTVFILLARRKKLITFIFYFYQLIGYARGIKKSIISPM